MDRRRSEEKAQVSTKRVKEELQWLLLREVQTETATTPVCAHADWWSGCRAAPRAETWDPGLPTQQWGIDGVLAMFIRTKNTHGHDSEISLLSACLGTQVDKGHM